MLIEETMPAVELLPLAALREHLRLGSGFELMADAAEDRALVGFLRAAMATIEGRTGKVLLRRQYRMRLDDWRDRMAQALPLAPVSSIQSIEIEDGSGGVLVVEPRDYRLIEDMQRPVLAPNGVILPHVPRRGAVTVRFTAGFGDVWGDVPGDLAQAVIALAARYYEDRGLAEARAALPVAVASLIERWRAVRTLASRGGIG